MRQVLRPGARCGLLLAWALLVAAAEAPPPLARFPGSDPGAGGVSVVVALRPAAGDAPPALVVTFTPDPADEPLHLYDHALPKTGIAGVGRPTLVALAPDQMVVAAGSLACDREPLPAADALRPYPAGPVCLTLPLRLADDADPAGAHIAVDLQLTYMACGTTFCRPPVTDRSVQVTLPVAAFAFAGGG